jgi:hypothetical protein
LGGRSHLQEKHLPYECLKVSESLVWVERQHQLFLDEQGHGFTSADLPDLGITTVGAE